MEDDVGVGITVLVVTVGSCIVVSSVVVLGERPDPLPSWIVVPSVVLKGNMDSLPEPAWDSTAANIHH